MLLAWATDAEPLLLELAPFPEFTTPIDGPVLTAELLCPSGIGLLVLACVTTAAALVALPVSMVVSPKWLLLS